MNAKIQFEKVTAICENLKSEMGESGATPSEVVTVTTAYLLACDRTDRFHHLEESPSGCFDPDETRDAQERSYEALWSIIGDANTKTNGARYQAAWDVWGVMLAQGDDTPGMQK